MHSYRGSIFQPTEDGKNVEMIDDGVITLADSGVVMFAGAVQDAQAQFRSKFGREHDFGKPTDNVLLPPTANTHDHAFQPPAVHGELVAKGEDGELVGWLPTTLREGELRAKRDPGKAHEMATSRLRAFVKNGVGAALEYSTSSVEAAMAVLAAGKDVGMKVRVGYVAMDQCIDGIAPGLQTTGEEAVQATREFLRRANGNGVVIDRFPIAVSSGTRRQLAEIAREHDVLYETHCAESEGERLLHEGIYGTPSIVETLVRDGVFAPGGKVGLAHMIHLSGPDLEMLRREIDKGCEVYVRACADSNAQLGSHWVGDNYKPFPLKELQEIGAVVTLGTDQGAGRNPNIFAEMLDERKRHPMSKQPSNVSLLKYGILDGHRSLGIDPASLRMRPGVPAEFTSVRMAGSGPFYETGHNHGDIESTAARVIEAGANSENVLGMYLNGRRVK